MLPAGHLDIRRLVGLGQSWALFEQSYKENSSPPRDAMDDAQHDYDNAMAHQAGDRYDSLLLARAVDKAQLTSPRRSLRSPPSPTG